MYYSTISNQVRLSLVERRNQKEYFCNPWTIIVFSFLVLFVSASVSASEAEYEPGELIIQLFDDTDKESLTEQFKNQNLRPIKQLSRRMHIWLFEYDYGSMRATDHPFLLSRVREKDEVSLAQFNHYVTRRSTFPDDPSFNQQWGLHNTGQSGGVIDADIDAPEAWDISTGGTTSLGDEIVVAIIDGGCDINHIDIDYWKNTLEIPGNSLDDDGNGYDDDYDGWNAYSSNGTIPSDYHGTHVAGIAAAIGNNNTGVSGVNWGAKIMPIAGSSTTESIVVEAYGYVFEMRSLYNETDGAAGAFIVSTNSSFGVDYGDPADFPIWCAMYDSLGSAGILSAAATANININIDSYGDVPTACASEYLLAVTNTTRNDTKNSGAAYGATTIDLGAPGTDIYSTYPSNSYGSSTGTSMATPHVAGAVALQYAAACPSMIQDCYNNPDIIALQMKQYLMDGTDPNSSLAGITVTGGRLNISNSLGLVQTYPCGITISHIPLGDTRDSLNDYEVQATITSTVPLTLDSLLLFYEISSTWHNETLVATGNPDEFHAYIPAQSPGTVVNYYLFARDDDGAADTTDTYTFRVLDYGLSLTPEYTENTVAAHDTSWYTLEVTNTGVYDDDYSLTTSGNIWITSFWDETGSYQISSTGLIAMDEVSTFKVMVEVPSSSNGDYDSVVVTASSAGDPGVTAQSSMKTISAGEPLTIPFVDSFPALTIDVGKWIYNVNAEVNTQGINPPSSPYSLNLDGNTNGTDTLMSQAINLKYESNVVISYYYQRTGTGDSPESGDDLFVEYLDSLGVWQVLSQHLGAEPDMAEFEQVQSYAPDDAYHSNFRLRLRNFGAEGNFDDWFVDDIRVDYAPAISITPGSITEMLMLGDSTTEELVINNAGPGELNYNIRVQPLALKNTTFEKLLAAGEVEPARRDYSEKFHDLVIHKGEDDPRHGIPVEKDAGGPDLYSYFWIDSNEPGGPAFDWIDVSTTGTDIVGDLSDDNYGGPYSIGFDFNFYGNTYSQLYIGSNGIIGFKSTDMDSRFKTSIPDSDTPSDILVWLWDDLNPVDVNNPGAHVYIDADPDRCVIQFVNYPEYSAEYGDVVNAEVILYPDGGIKYQYLSIGSGFDTENCTIGIENSDGTIGLEVAYLTAYLHDALTIQFYRPQQWLFMSQTSGELMVGEYDVIISRFITEGLDTGLYNANIIINSNDPDPADNPWTVPVQLTVTDEPPYICGDINNNGAGPDISDLTYLVDYMFNGGPAPPVPDAADIDNSGDINVSDLTYMVDYLFNGGPAPVCQ